MILGLPLLLRGVLETHELEIQRSYMLFRGPRGPLPPSPTLILGLPHPVPCGLQQLGPPRPLDVEPLKDIEKQPTHLQKNVNTFISKKTIILPKSPKLAVNK